MITGDYKPGFFTRLYQKDLRLVNETAMANDVPMPATAIVTQFVNALVSRAAANSIARLRRKCGFVCPKESGR